MDGQFDDFYDLLRQAFKEKRCHLRSLDEEIGEKGTTSVITSGKDDLATIEVC